MRYLIMAHVVDGFDGPAEKLAEFLLSRSDDLVHQIYFPLLKISKPQTRRIYKKNGNVEVSTKARKFKPPISYFFDMLNLVNFQKYEHGISFNPLCTIILALQFPRKPKIISTYYVDSHVRNQKNSFKDRIYRLIERLSYRLSNNIIDTSKLVQDYKFESGIYSKKNNQKHYIISPISYSNKLLRNPQLNDNSKRIVYFGNINRRNGVEKFIEISSILGPDYVFDVIGAGDLLDSIIKQVNDKGIANRFNFFGYIASMDNVFDIMSRASLGIAPFSTSTTDSYTFFADPGKIRAYIVCGLPIITNNAALISSEFIRQKVGVVLDIKASAQEYAFEIAKLFQNTNLLEEFQSNVYKIRNNYTDEVVFSHLIDELES